MSAFSSKLVPERIRLLVVRDADIASTNRLAEHFVHQEPQFTAVILCGPLASTTDDTEESVALAMGHMSTTIAQLENIVCRVIYLPATSDPAEVIFKQLHPTPNSVNIHARWLQLAPGLSIGGYTEKSQLEKKVVDSEDADDAEDDEEGGRAYIQASNSSDVIKELLRNFPGQETPSDVSVDDVKVSTSTASSDSDHHSIFVLDTSYAHTLNQVLFHSETEMSHAGVRTCICPSLENRDQTTAGAKKKIKNLDLLGPLSLKDGNNYMVLEYEASEGASPVSKRWALTSSELLQL